MKLSGDLGQAVLHLQQLLRQQLPGTVLPELLTVDTMLDTLRRSAPARNGTPADGVSSTVPSTERRTS